MGWTLEDIAWDRFDPARVDPDILAVVKAAAMVERNAADYTRYLRAIFQDDPQFQAETDRWQIEEEQHGDALGAWAELADSGFNYQAACRRFTEGYKIPQDGDGSVRGSLTGELIARCIVETGTSSFYSALRDATTEPVLRDICHRIAGDEFRHFKLFYATMQAYLKRENIPAWKRLLVAVSRIRESEDDELAYAWFAANAPADAVYNRSSATAAYGTRAYRLYQPAHVTRATHMVLKACGLNPQGLLGTVASRIMWRYIASRARIPLAESMPQPIPRAA